MAKMSDKSRETVAAVLFAGAENWSVLLALEVREPSTINKQPEQTKAVCVQREAVLSFAMDIGFEPLFALDD